MTESLFVSLVGKIKSRLSDAAVNFDLPENQEAALAIPVFSLAKEQQVPISEAAAKVKASLADLEDIELDIVGGFVNIQLKPDAYPIILEEAKREDFGTTNLGQGKNVIIDYSSPNIAKPMSIGHLRSTVIGDALKRLYRSQGYKVISINFLGDWGTQFGKLLVAYQKKYGDFEPREISINELLELYISFHKQAENYKQLEDDARELFAKLDSGDETLRKLWQKLVDLSIIELKRIYNQLGIEKFDVIDGESKHVKGAEEVIELAQKKNLSRESEGALIIDLPALGTPLLLKKQDGTTLYASRDLAAIKDRIDKFKPKKIIYVVANEQALHFQQVFSVAVDLGFTAGTELIHAKFGLISLPEGKISTRQGRVIFLEDVLSEAVKRAQLIVKEKNNSLRSAEIEDIAKKIGIGALKFYDLMNSRNHDIVFDWEKMLSLKGQASPYLQYSYTRASSILRKAGEIQGNNSLNLSQFKKQLILLAKFPLVIGSSIDKDSPHILAQYLLQVAGEFHSFYEKYPVLNAETDKTERIMLVEAFANVLKAGLSLLGIEVSDQM